MWQEIVSEIVVAVSSSLSLKFYKSIKKALSKEFSVLEISNELEKGNLSFDKSFFVTGTFSEYIPFVDFASLIKEEEVSESIGTCRLGDILENGTYMGAVFPEKTENANIPSVPIIYSKGDKSRKLFAYSTGDQLRLECRLVPLDYNLRNLISKKAYFCYDGKPFGLKVLDVNRQVSKRVDRFQLDAFVLSSIDYEDGESTYFSAIKEIANYLYSELGSSPLLMGLMLDSLVRDSKLKAQIAMESNKIAL